MKTPGMYSGCNMDVTWSCREEYLATYLVLQWLIPDNYGTKSSSIWRIIFKTLLSGAPLFVRGVLVFKEALNFFCTFILLACWTSPLWTSTIYVICHWERKYVLLLSTCYWLMPIYYQHWTVLTWFSFAVHSIKDLWYFLTTGLKKCKGF